MTSTGISHQRNPVTMEKGENVLCKLRFDIREFMVANPTAQSKRQTVVTALRMNLPGLKRKRPQSVAS